MRTSNRQFLEAWDSRKHPRDKGGKWKSTTGKQVAKSVAVGTGVTIAAPPITRKIAVIAHKPVHYYGKIMDKTRRKTPGLSPTLRLQNPWHIKGNMKPIRAFYKKELLSADPKKVKRATKFFAAAKKRAMYKTLASPTRMAIDQVRGIYYWPKKVGVPVAIGLSGLYLAHEMTKKKKRS